MHGLTNSIDNRMKSWKTLNQTPTQFMTFVWSTLGRRFTLGILRRILGGAECWWGSAEPSEVVSESDHVMPRLCLNKRPNEQLLMAKKK